MEQREAVSEEHGDKPCDVHGTISEITYRDYEPHSDLPLFRPVGLEYWQKVNGKDLSQLKEYWHNDEVHQVPEIDLKVVQLVRDGAKIRMALLQGDIIGFMIYYTAYDCIVIIEGMYVDSAFRRQGIGCQFIDSLEKPIQRLFFQTHISIKPEKLFEALDHRDLKREKIMVQDDLITWQCEWRKRNG